MSSKVLSRGEAAGAQPIAWRRAAAAEPNPMAPRLGAAGSANLEARLAELERETERRVRQAREAALREAETAAAERAAAGLEPVLARLGRTIDELAACRARFRREAEQDLVKLALAVARRILHRELAIDPAALAGVVKAALERLDARETHRVRLNRQDAAALAPLFAELGLPERVEVFTDNGLERGAVVFETARGHLDASVATQLDEIERGFADLVRRRP